MSDVITKRKERLNLPHNLKERYEKSGLACTYEEWLEDAVRELVMSTQTRWDRITELEQENARLREAILAIHDYDMKRARPTGWQCDWTLFALIDNAVRAALNGEVGDE